MPEDKVEEIRNGLRTKRTDALGPNSEPAGGETRTGFQTILGEGRSAFPTHRPTRLVAGGSNEEPGRQRRAVGRSGGDNRSLYDGTSIVSARAGGRRKRIKAEDTISRTYEEGLKPSVTIPKRPVGRPPKIIAALASADKKVTDVVRETFSSSGKKQLSKQEATLLEEPLKAVIPDMAEYLDELIWWQTHDVTHDPVWSDLDTDEIDVITRLLLKQGQKNAVVAEGVRTMVDAADWVAAGMIVIPRSITSMKKLTAIAAEERKKKLEARYATTDQRPFVSE